MWHFTCIWEMSDRLGEACGGTLPSARSKHTNLLPHCSYTQKQIELFIIAGVANVTVCPLMDKAFKFGILGLKFINIWVEFIILGNEGASTLILWTVRITLAF